MRLLFALLVVFPISVLAQKISIAPAPDWVVPSTEEVALGYGKYEVSSGYYANLVDYQNNMETGEGYAHFRFKVFSEVGVSALSEIALGLDTTYQSAKFHFARIIRNGQVIDKTPEISFDLINNETQQLEKIYNGTTTALGILRDVRKGDLLEYAYTMSGDNPLFEDYDYIYYPIIDANPVDKMKVRILYDTAEGFELYQKEIPEAEISISKLGKLTECKFERDAMDAFEPESTMPNYLVFYPYLAVSNFKDWADVNSWGKTLFERVLSEKDKTAVDNFISQSLSSNDDKREKLTAALEFLQNDVRYLGLEGGLGSMQPRPPSHVLEKMYGDCKDKSLLFAEVGKALGFDVKPALVSGTFQSEIANLPPGGSLFSHCITLIVEGKDSIWVDPTSQYQGGKLEDKFVYDYGYALVIGESDLVKMNPNDTKSATEVDLTISLPDFSGSATLQIVSKYRGADADGMRGIFEYMSFKEIEKELRSIPAQLYPFISSAQKLKVVDDLEKNTFTLTENYALEKIFREEQGSFVKNNVFSFEPYHIYDYLINSECTPKVYPVSLAYPVDMTLNVRLEFPESVRNHMRNMHIEEGAYSFEILADNPTPEVMAISYNITISGNEMNSDDFVTLCGKLNALSYELPMEIRFPKTSTE